MGGFFGIASQTSCIEDLFFGTDYHSHLGTKRGGISVIQPDVGFVRTIHKGLVRYSINRLYDSGALVQAIGLPREKLCTCYWNGEEIK